MTLYIVLAFLIGGSLGYLIFFLRYGHKGLVDELRENFQETKRQLDNVQLDAQEHLQQNVILKEKVTDLMTKNDDLSRIVSELSRYYYHIKLGAEKATELEKILHVFDKDIEEKMRYTLGEKILESINENKKEIEAPVSVPNVMKDRVIIAGGKKW